jgi:hypothetical protein
MPVFPVPYPQLVVAGNEEYVPEAIQEKVQRTAQDFQIVTHVPGDNERIAPVGVRRQLLQLPQIVAEIRVNV